MSHLVYGDFPKCSLDAVQGRKYGAPIEDQIRYSVSSEINLLTNTSH